MEPRVTICIPTYNQARYLPDAVESALAQDCPGLEVVVADDASTDATPRVLDALQKKGDPRLRIARTPTNLGRVANYRRCLYALARGQWVLNLDGDDYLCDPGFVSTALEAAGRYENVVLVGAGHVERKGESRRERLPVERESFFPGSRLFLAWGAYPLVHLATLYHRDTARRIGFYREPILNTDHESMLRLLLHGNAVLLPLAAGVWRVNQGSASQDLRFEATRQALRCYAGPAAHARELGAVSGLRPETVSAWERACGDKLLADYLYRVLRLASGAPPADAEFLHGELAALRRYLPFRVPPLAHDKRDAAKLALFKLLGTELFARLTGWGRDKSV